MSHFQRIGKWRVFMKQIITNNVYEALMPNMVPLSIRVIGEGHRMCGKIRLWK